MDYHIIEGSEKRKRFDSVETWVFARLRLYNLVPEIFELATAKALWELTIEGGSA